MPAWVVLLTWAVPSPSGAALVLAQPPSVGLLGAAADVLRVAGGRLSPCLAHMAAEPFGSKPVSWLSTGIMQFARVAVSKKCGTGTAVAAEAPAAHALGSLPPRTRASQHDTMCRPRLPTPPPRCSHSRAAVGLLVGAGACAAHGCPSLAHVHGPAHAPAGRVLRRTAAERAAQPATPGSGGTPAGAERSAAPGGAAGARCRHPGVTRAAR